MAQFIELPHVGESVVEGTIGKWLKQPGDRVERYDPLVEVVTDKVTMEVPSPVSGELLRIIAQEGETVPMGAPIAEVDDGSGPSTSQPTAASVPTATAPAPVTPPAPAAAPASSTPTSYLITDARPVGPTGGSAVEAQSQEGSEAPAEPARAASMPPTVIRAVDPDRETSVERAPNRLSPAVRRLAAEHNLDVDRIAGTGMGGRVTRNDVLRYLEQQAATVATAVPATAPSIAAPAAAAAPAAPATDEERVALTPVRRMIADAMVRSVTQIPHAWSMVEVDITNLVALRNRERDQFRAREGVNLTYLPFALKAVASALKDNPTMNASWGDDCIILKRRINLGIAVAAPSGLVVPVIHDADRLSISGLAHAVADLSERARGGTLRLDDVQGGTFTVNNTGALGSVLGGPIINHPQAGILTTEAVQQRPVVISDAIAIRWMMNLCLSFDHRINDGAESGAFMQSVKARLEAMDGDTPIY
ncbi:MAG: dihydrolipoamide acetyltransferase family protein [Chloroflexi bacterium]|nr:dihydrolipoamide acetyltransferase family protein [Chloroflexota bacterium]